MTRRPKDTARADTSYDWTPVPIRAMAIDQRSLANVFALLTAAREIAGAMAKTDITAAGPRLIDELATGPLASNGAC